MHPPLQKLFAPFAIPRILRILAGFQGLLYVLMMIQGQARARLFLDNLTLDFGMIAHGQVWRLISFILLLLANPFGSTGILFLLIAVMFLFFLNDLLEAEWGQAGLNAYFYIGYVGSLLGGLLLWLVIPEAAAVVAYALPRYFAASWLLAGATLAPRQSLLLFFIIPVPFWVFGAFAGLGLLFAAYHLFGGHPLLALVPVLCVLNYVITFLPPALRGLGHRGDTIKRRRRFEQAQSPDTEAFHTCAKCGATEISHPEREFRVSRDGDEFCNECKKDT